MVRPSLSRSKTDSAVSVGVRPFWAATTTGTKSAGARTSARIKRARSTAVIVATGRRRGQAKSRSADGLFELLRWLEARDAAGHGNGLAGSRIPHRPRTAPGHREGAETDQRDRIPPLE